MVFTAKFLYDPDDPPMALFRDFFWAIPMIPNFYNLVKFLCEQIITYDHQSKV